MRRILTLATLAFAANATAAQTTVNCNRGESLSSTLAGLDRTTPSTVVVRGTCVEWVSISGFEGLTLKSTTGAKLRQPEGPTPKLPVGLLTIEASNSVTVEGLQIEASTVGDSNHPGIIIRHGSTDVRLRKLTVLGGSAGIYVYERSQVSMAGVTVRTAGWGALGIWDSSVVHMEDSLLENPNDGWQAGISIGSAVVVLHGTTIRNMWNGIDAYEGATVKTADFNDYYPEGGPVAVVIENLTGTSMYGLTLRNGATASLESAKLRIVRPGASRGGDTSGVLLDGGSAFTGGNNLEIENSQSQGVFVANNSHADLSGAAITGSLQNGVVVVSNSTVALGSNSLPTTISGSSKKDLFCDGTSGITGKANAPSAVNVACSNLLDGVYPPIP